VCITEVSSQRKCRPTVK